MVYDAFIVGAGYAGAVCARRLAEDVRQLVRALRQSGVGKTEALALVERLWEEDTMTEGDLP